MAFDKPTFWVEFDKVVTPRNTKADIFRYSCFTVTLNEDNYKTVTDRKLAIVNNVKQALKDWFIRHKFKDKTPKKELHELTFNDGKVNCVIKNFIVKKAFINI